MLESMPRETVKTLRELLDGIEQDFVTIADLLFNLHYGPALEQLTATQLDAEGLLAYTRESVETVSLALGCCSKQSRGPRHDADSDDSTGETPPPQRPPLSPYSAPALLGQDLSIVGSSPFSRISLLCVRVAVGDDDGFFFRVLAIAVAFFGTVCCVQLFASAGSSGGGRGTTSGSVP